MMPERWFERHSQNGGPQFCRHSTIYFEMLLWLEGGEDFAWDLPAPRRDYVSLPFSPPEPHKLKLVWGIYDPSARPQTKKTFSNVVKLPRRVTGSHLVLSAIS